MSPTQSGQTRERVFRFIRDRLLAGDPPTVREVQRVFGFATPQTARYHLEKLVTEGRLAAARGKARGYRLLNQPEPMASIGWVPLVGRVQAGRPIEATEDIEGYVPVPADLAGALDSDELFALRVQGSSMVGVGILPGDVVIVRRQSTADSGALVVALVDDEATVKRLQLRNGKVELHPENPDFDPILLHRDITLLGKVIEVRRSVS